MKVPQEVLAVLDRCETRENRLVLPGALDRRLYLATNKVVELAGGKWDRRAQAHLFQCDAADRIEQIMMTGEVENVRQEFDQFYTPLAISNQVVSLAHVAGLRVLEPSAGQGSLAVRAALSGAADVVCIEIDPKNIAALKPNFPRAILADFLHLHPGEALGAPFDRVIMNPPFSRQAEGVHVLRALKWLRPGGRLVSVMSAAVTFRETEAYRHVRAAAAQIIPLPPGSFKSAGTMVNTCIVVIDA